MTVKNDKTKIKVTPKHPGQANFRIYNMLVQQPQRFDLIENDKSLRSASGMSLCINVIKTNIPNSSPAKFLKVS